MAEYFQIKQYLRPWGVNPHGLPLARSYICPHCGCFSFFSSCDPARSNAAIEWRGSTVGFDTIPNGSYSAGVAALHCPKCDKKFAVMLTSTVIPAYVADCPAWRQANNLPK